MARFSLKGKVNPPVCHQLFAAAEEIIDLMEQEIRNTIVAELQQAKYFSLIIMDLYQIYHMLIH